MPVALTKPRTRPIDRHVGERLRALRTGRGLSFDELAGRLGISAARLDAYEAGRERMRPLTLYAIADAMGVPLAQFFAAEVPREWQADELARFASPETRDLLRAWQRLGAEDRRRALAVVQAVAGKAPS